MGRVCETKKPQKTSQLFNKSTVNVMQNEQIARGFTEVGEHFDQIDAKVDAIIGMLTMKQEMHNLIRQLKMQGIALDESKIFIT